MLRTGDVLRKVTGASDDAGRVARSVEHEGWNADRREHVPDVDLHVHPRVRGGAAGAGAPAQEGGERTVALLVGARCESSCDSRRLLRRAPAPRHPLDVFAVVVLARSVRVVGGPEHPRVRADRDQRPHPLRIRGGEQDAHRAALGQAEQSRALRPDRVHHRADVVHARLQRRRAHGVGHPLSSLVEADEAAERRELRQEVGVVGNRPRELDVRGERRDVDDVERAVAGDLIRDRDVAAARVASLGLHPRIVAHVGSSSERSSTARPRSSARICSASTVSATGVSSRNSSRPSKSATSARIAVS